MNIRSIFLALLLASLIPQSFAIDCGSLVAELRNLQSKAFDEFPRLNDMKQDALLALYGRERATCPNDLIDLSVSTRDFISDFTAAYNLSKSGKEDKPKALESSIRLVASAKDFSRFNLGVETDDLKISAQQSIKEFLIIQGKDFAGDAEKSAATRDKIFNLKRATESFEAAGEDLEATALRLNWMSMEEAYVRDMEKADDLYNRGIMLYTDAAKLSPLSIFSKMNAYVLSRESHISLNGALKYYQHHLEDERTAKTQKGISDAEELLEGLRGDIAYYLAVLGMSLIGISLFLLNRLMSWNMDSYDYSLGNELVRVSGVEE